MNQEKRAREIEQFFITITRASAALVLHSSAISDCRSASTASLTRSHQPVKSESGWENLPNRSFLVPRD